jgi:hypothetical protein
MLSGRTVLPPTRNPEPFGRIPFLTWTNFANPLSASTFGRWKYRFLKCHLRAWDSVAPVTCFCDLRMRLNPAQWETGSGLENMLYAVKASELSY